MKNFEERYTAWIDGALDGRERTEFEENLPNRVEALREREGWRELRGLMRESLVPAEMPHGDFIQSQVLAAIERESRVEASAAGWFPARRLAWLGAFLLAVAGALTAIIVPNISRTPGEDRYVSFTSVEELKCRRWVPQTLNPSHGVPRMLRSTK